MEENLPQCARCPYQPDTRSCKTMDGKHPEGCPTTNEVTTCTEALGLYKQEPTATFAREASLQEKDGYSCWDMGYDHLRPAKPRIEEIFDFIERMGYARIGLAFCIGLRKEAAVVDRLFDARSLELVSAICKVGRAAKEELGLDDADKISAGTFEPMCNPILQARILNNAKTEFNILLGLCVGHDSLFLQHAQAPCTVLAVKDRVTGHNPLAALYTIDSYYRALKQPKS